MPNNNRNVTATRVKCRICNQVMRPAKLQNHLAMMHRANIPTQRALSRRNRRNKQRTGNVRQQIRQPSNNLPVPTTLGQTMMTRGVAYGNRGQGKRGYITSQIDKAIDQHFTQEGAAFVHRACHPNDESRGGGVFVPDDTTADRAVLEERPYGVISKPDSLETENWDCEIAVLPVPDAPYIFRTRATGSTRWSDWHLGGSSSFVKPGRILMADRVSEEATVVDPKQQAQPILTPSLLTDTTQFRQAFSGLTIVLNCSSLKDEGYVTAGQWGNKAKIVEQVPYRAPFSTGNFPTGFDDPRYEPSKVETLVYEQVPVEVNDIVASCPEFGQWEAKKGVYMPMRFDDPVHMFNGGAISVLTDIAAGSGAKMKTGFPIALVDATTETIEIAHASQYLIARPDDRSELWTSAGQINQTFGVIMFTGINASSSLICKMRTGLDLVPSSTSPFSAFTQKGPVKDQLAIDMATSIQAKLPLVYEHKYNLLGWLGGLVGQAARTLLPAFAPWLGQQVEKGTHWLGQKIFGGGMPNI